MHTKHIISRSVAHRYHGVFLVFEFDRFFSEVELHPRLSHQVAIPGTQAATHSGSWGFVDYFTSFSLVPHSAPALCRS